MLFNEYNFQFSILQTNMNVSSSYFLMRKLVRQIWFFMLEILT